MKRNKKLISLICAVAMIFSILSGLAVTANAAGEGLTLKVSEFDTSKNTITVDVGYTGMSTVGYGTFLLKMPAGVTKVTANPAGAESYNDGIYSYTWTYGTSPVTVDTADGSGKITTLTLEAEGLTSDAEITFVNSAGELATAIGDADYNDYELSAGTLANAKATLPHNPNAPETVDTTPAPVAEDDPNVTPKPSLAPEVTTEIGFSFGEPTEVDDTTITVDVNYEGMQTVGYGTFLVKMPSEVTSVKADPSGAELYKDNVYAYTWTYGTSPVSSDSGKGKITTLTLELSKPLTEEKQLVFVEKLVNGEDVLQTIIGDAEYNDFILGETEGVSASSVNLPYSAEEIETYDIDLDDALTKTVTDTVGDNGESEYFIIPEVTVNDGPATYGEDYVAVIGDTELTPAQYSNIINGHFDAPNVKQLLEDNDIDDINDVIKNLKIRAYNSNAKVSAKLVQKDTGIVADSGEAKVEPSKPDNPTYKKPTLSVKASKTSTTVGSGDTITVTATYDFKDYANNATVAISAVDDTLDLATSSGFKIEYEQAEEDLLDLVTKIEDGVTLIDNIAEKGTIKITYKPGSVGTAKFTFAITGQNEAGTVLDPAVTGSASTKINKASTSGSGSGSSSKDSDNKSSGGGAIATGLVDSGSGYLPSLGFDDLGDVEWAQNAINTLAAKKIVSGVGDNKFDPNAALTRAAYAQMLVNAIGHSQDSADVEFDDVPTDAWFYHNVAVAAQLGIVAGFGDGTFRPYDLITREQMALMTQKAAVVMGKSLVGADAGTFTDDADIADWSRDAVYQLSNAGIINGMGDGSFAPQANATRAQAAVIIYQAFVK